MNEFTFSYPTKVYFGKEQQQKHLRLSFLTISEL